MRRFYPAQKINLTARPEWKMYTLVDEHFGRLVMESTMGTIDSLNADDVAHYAQRFVKTLITDEQKAYLFEAWRSNRLELYRTMVNDASDWAWIDAYTPTDLDLDKALQSALRDITGSYFHWLDDYSNIFQVANIIGYHEQWRFISEILTKDTIYIQDKKPQGERFLIFSPMSSPLMERIVTKPILKKQEGILDWEPAPASWNNDLIREFTELLDALRDTTIEKIFHYLKARMYQVDYNTRMHFHEKFNSMLFPRSSDVRAVSKEIRDALSGSPSLGANPFMNPRNRRLERDFIEMSELAAASPIMKFEALGEPPEKYRIRFSGMGLDPAGTIRNVHDLTIDLGSEYPRFMPRIHWQTPILHPNISSGTPCFGNFAMNPRVRLVDLVEILWDMNRMAIYNTHGNQPAWTKIRQEIDFPVDQRTIRGEVPRAPDQGGDVDLIILGR